MKKYTQKTRHRPAFHPFLFALYFVAGAYAQNASQVPIAWVTRPLIIVILSTGTLYILLWIMFRDQEYAGFVTTLFLNWIFIGYLYRILLDQSPFWGTSIGGFIFFLIITVPLAFLVSRWLWKKITGHQTITTFMNVTSLILVIFPLWTMAGIIFTGKLQLTLARELQSQVNVSLTQSPPATPDVYVIIVDGYGRSDFLRDSYGFDNKQMIDFLKTKGFYVAESSTSNYSQTQLSLSSLLNLQYLNETLGTLGATNDRMALFELVQHPIIRQFLEDNGYTFVALASAVLTTQIRDADVYLSPINSSINEFDAFLLSSTLIGIAADAWDIDLPVMGYELHRKYVLYSLEKMKDVPALPGSKLVFAHIMLPHPPFIFDSHGNFIPPQRTYIMFDGSLFPGTTQEYQYGYTEQLTYLNLKLMTMISDILETSENPPIIILQGDHGPGSYFNLDQLENPCLKERYSILNAYYFPDKNYSRLYPAITPVNSFRVILNQYFGTDLELLEDRNYYATWLAPYVFRDVTEKAQSCDVVSRQAP